MEPHPTSHGKNHRKNQAKKRRQIENKKKEEKTSMAPATTHRGKVAAEFEGLKGDIADARLQFKKTEATFQKWKPYMSKAEIDDFQSKMDQLRHSHAAQEQNFQFKLAQYDNIVQRVKNLMEPHVVQSKAKQEENSNQRPEGEEEDGSAPRGGRIQALLANIDVAMAKNKGVMKDVDLLNAQTVALIGMHDELKVEAASVW